MRHRFVIPLALVLVAVAGGLAVGGKTAIGAAIDTSNFSRDVRAAVGDAQSFEPPFWVRGPS